MTFGTMALQSAFTFSNQLSQDMIKQRSDMLFNDLANMLCASFQDGKSSTAAEKVFQMPELLENILVFVPTKQLFVIRRVSSIFRNVVEVAPTLKYSLFLAHQPRPTFSNDGMPIMTPLVESLLSNLGFKIVDYWYRDGDRPHLILQFNRPRLRIPSQSNTMDGLPRNELKASWRCTKITAFPTPITVQLEDGGGPGAWQYSASRDLNGEQATLGALWDFAYQNRDAAIVKPKNAHKKKRAPSRR